MRPTITIENLGKQYRHYQIDRPFKLKEALLRGFRGVRPAAVFWALHNVSFDVRPGHMLGVIGDNGAGKSTLLRLIGGVGRPDKGKVTCQGRIVGFLDIGAGFHPELTGRENIFVNGIIAGLTRREVKQKFDSIIAFAELEAFIDNPLRTYSSGMRMRLGFAVVAHTNPQILLIDEILAVGDRSFQNKCLDRIAQFKANGCTIVLASHNLDSVRQFCNEAIWLERGRLMAHAAANVVVDQYLEQS